MCVAYIALWLPLVQNLTFCQSDLQFDSRILDASTFVQKLQAETSNNLLRGPYLANLEIERRKLLYGKKNDEELMEALLQYFLRYLKDFISSTSYFHCIIVWIFFKFSVHADK